MEQLGSHRTVCENTSFVKFGEEYRILYRKTDIQFDHISLSSFRMKNISDKSLQRKSKHAFYVQYLFLSENCAVYEVIWRNIEKPNRSQMAI